MKNFKFSIEKLVIVILMVTTLVSLSCTFDEEFDPNRPSRTVFGQNCISYCSGGVRILD